MMPLVGGAAALFDGGDACHAAAREILESFLARARDEINRCISEAVISRRLLSRAPE
jgi:hypothetical protein